jgi:nucleoside phosphorylase
VLTGDRFVTRKALSEMSWLREELDGAAVEMEGASVAFVAVLNALPFLLVRTISDKADTEARVDFERFLARASTNSADFLEFLLARL